MENLNIQQSGKSQWRGLPSSPVPECMMVKSLTYIFNGRERHLHNILHPGFAGCFYSKNTEMYEELILQSKSAMDKKNPFDFKSRSKQSSRFYCCEEASLKALR